MLVTHTATRRPWLHHLWCYLFYLTLFTPSLVSATDMTTSEETVSITVLDGTTGQNNPLVDKRVSLHILEGDHLAWVSNLTSNPNGNVSAVLEGVTSGAQYVVKVQHPITGKWMTSDLITSTEAFTFVVGTLPLNITLLNPVTNAPVTATRVDAHRYRHDGSRYREARQTTDDNGQVTFHLAEITDAKPVELHLTPPEGYFAKATLTSTGSHNVIFGNTQITVRNGRLDGSPLMIGTRLRVYHARADKSQSVFNRDIGATGSVLVDLPALQNGESYYAEVTIEGDKYRHDFTATGAHDFTFGNINEDLIVTLLDGTGATPVPLVDKRVAVHRVDPDKLRWISNKNTDDSGVTKVALRGLSEGQQFVLKAQHPISGKWFESSVISANDNFSFTVGSAPLVITLKNPVTGAPVTATRVDAHRYREDGSRYREARQTSDDNGQVTFHLSEISDSQPVELHLNTPEGYFAKATLTSTGNHDVVFGDTQITVRNGRIDGSPLMSGTRLRVYHARADKNQNVFNRDIGASGSVLVDLPDLQDGESYYAEVTIQGDKYRQDFTSAGAHDFTFGNVGEDLIVTLLDGTGADPVPMTDKRIAVYRVDPDKLRWISNKNTDETGVAKVALRGLSEGQQFVLKAQHPISGKWFESAAISNNENFTFTVGSSPLVVTLKNPVTGAPVTNTRVDALRFREDGSRYREARQTTDDNGQVTFHLTEISDEKLVELHLTTPEGYFAKSTLTSTGSHDVTFGDTQITVRNGRIDGSPLMTGSRLRVYHARADKNQNVFNRDIGESGSVLMDLPDLQDGESYYAEVTIEGDKYRHDFTSAGAHDFTFGDIGEDLTVTLLDGTGAEPIPMVDKRISVHRVDPDKLRWISNKDTDESGVAKVALRGLSEGQQFVLKAQHPISGKWFESDVITNNSDFDFVVGITPMVVTLVHPVTEAAIVDARIDVKRQREDGSWYREDRGNTDENGQDTFHLTEVSASQPALLQAWSPDGFFAEMTVTSSGAIEFPLGDTQITLRNGRAEGNPIITGERVRIFHVTETERKRIFNRDVSGEGTIILQLPETATAQDVFDVEVEVEDDKYTRQFSGTGGHDLVFGDLNEDVLVTLLDGTQAQPTPITDWRIALHRVDEDKLRWVSNKNTDDSGVAKLALNGLSEGKQFVLKAQHTITGKWFSSEMIGNNSDFTFVVGAPALVVNLFHPRTGLPMPNTRMDIHRQRDDESWYREARMDTDENGQATFYLKAISEADPIEIRTVSADGFWASTEITSTRTIDLPFGNVPVQVIDKETGAPIVGKRLEALWMDADNKLTREARYNTNAEGEVLFELDRLVENVRYALKLKNPFGENKTYYGPIVYGEGAIEFLVKKGEQTELDLVDPEVFITSPTRQNVNGVGFLLGGSASDDNSIARIEVAISDPIKGVTQGEATLLSSGQWQFAVPDTAITLDQTITITATAFDLALNSAQTSQSYTVVEDMEPPTISIVSHNDNDDVNETGFTVIGDAFDDTGVVTVSASLSDPLLGTTIEDQAVSVAEDGQWALIVTNGKVSGGQTVLLDLTATDSSDKTQNISIRLVVQTIVPQQQQLISRITFGMTPDLYINQPNANTFMAQQLAPASIDDSEIDAQISAMNIMELGDLRAMQLHYMLYSQRQLNEVMTWFWDNHFNTNYNVHRNVAYELAENQGFRIHALGNFRDLLEVSAKSPAMIYYLNNAENVVGRPNENYSREIMELHTLGVDGGYTAEDIANLARIFTGWHEQDGSFFFNDAQHDFDNKTFLGVDINGVGLAEGEQALDILASHPSTARNICRKLITLFVSDIPVSGLQGQCEGQFLASGGNIASVVQVILSSNEFVSLEHQGNKIKTPVEMVLAAIRSVNATPNYPDINDTLADLGYSLFTFPVPTGLAETGPEWISSNALLQRINFANRFALEGQDGASVDLQSLLMAMGYSSADAIVGVLADLTLNGRLTDLERDIATQLLNENIAEGESFNIQSNEASEKLQRLLGTMLSYPAFQYQ